MKRIVLLVVGILSALIVAAPMVLAQPNGGKPTKVDETPIDLDPGAVFGYCDDPISLVYSGKAKTLQLPGERLLGWPDRRGGVVPQLVQSAKPTTE